MVVRSLHFWTFVSFSEALGEFMEGRGAVSPGILTLTTGLSKPFMRLDKYPTLLKELERHMEVCVLGLRHVCVLWVELFFLHFISSVFFQEIHLDRPDIQKCMVSFKNLSVSCTLLPVQSDVACRQVWSDSIRLSAPLTTGSVPGGAETKRVGAPDSHGEHPTVGGWWHQDPGLCDLHEPGLGAESHDRGIYTLQLLFFFKSIIQHAQD